MSKPNPFIPGSKLVSELLADDPDLRDVVEEFVDGLTARIEELQSAHRAEDFEKLAMLAHRLKGAGGSYGYPAISKLGASMESAFESHSAEQFAAWVEQLTELSNAARAGLDL